MRLELTRRALRAGITAILAAAACAVGAQTPARIAPTLTSDAAGRGLVAISGGSDSCTDNDHVEQQAGSAGTTGKVCQVVGSAYIGPAVGQVSSITGPSVAGPSLINSLGAAGDIISGRPW